MVATIDSSQQAEAVTNEGFKTTLADVRFFNPLTFLICYNNYSTTTYLIPAHTYNKHSFTIAEANWGHWICAPPLIDKQPLDGIK